MPPDSTEFIQYLLDPKQFTLLKIIAGTGGLLGIMKAALDLWGKWQDKRALKMVGKELTHEFFDDEIIKTYTEIYVEPYCSPDDPSNKEDDLREIYGKGNHKKLFMLIDEFMAEGSNSRHMYLLGDSGTGKTAALINILMRNYRQGRSRKKQIVVFRLDRKNVDEYIDGITAKEKKNTVLFLDAFDEDPQAIDDIDNRYNELVDLMEGFNRVVISSRTQFFPNATAIKRETLIPDISADRKSGYRTFSIQYLLPFDDEQVRKFVNKRYRLWNYRLRGKARRIIDNAPSLALRPMLLKYMSSFTDSEKTYNNSVQIYEEIVNRWINRERIRDKAALRKFSEVLADNLYKNRRYNNGQIARGELRPFALSHGIDLDELELSSRSLLNQDGYGNYKFAHRSIMEYLFVKRFISLPVAERPELAWTDQMNRFLWEIIQDNLHNYKSIKFALDKIDVHGLAQVANIEFQKLNYEPRKLSDSDVSGILKRRGFYDSRKNKKAKGISHLYMSCSSPDGKILFDLATGLSWQQSGSDKRTKFKAAQDYINELNQEKFAGYSNWRLPTLEEAMSLMEPAKNKNGLHINSNFDETQHWIWTSDEESALRAWVVNFFNGYCSIYDIDSFIHVRAVR